LNGLTFDLEYFKVPEIIRRIKSERKELRSRRWDEYFDDPLDPGGTEYEEIIQYEEWEKNTPLGEALLGRKNFYELFCDGTFWYFWTVDKLREILGENVRKEAVFDREEEMLDLRRKQRNIERHLTHLKSKHECRNLMVESLKTKYKMKWSQKVKKNNDIISIRKEDIEEKDEYLKLFVKFREVSKSLEEMELAKLRSLQRLIPNKYMENNGIDMEEDRRIGEVMKIIIESWKDVGGSGLKYVNKDRCLSIILNTVFLALNDKFVYNDDIPK
jgi:hypothetical protein